MDIGAALIGICCVLRYLVTLMLERVADFLILFEVLQALLNRDHGIGSRCGKRPHLVQCQEFFFAGLALANIAAMLAGKSQFRRRGVIFRRPFAQSKHTKSLFVPEAFLLVFFSLFFARRVFVQVIPKMI